MTTKRVDPYLRALGKIVQQFPMLSVAELRWLVRRITEVELPNAVAAQAQGDHT